MSDPVASSRTRDPVATGATVLYGTGVVVALLCVVAGLVTRTWLFAGIFGVLLVVFAAQTYGWSQAATCRIEVDATGVRRRGPLGWGVEHAEVDRWSVVAVRGRPYLVVVPRLHPARTNMSRALLGGAMPRGSVVGPLAPAAVDDVRAALLEAGRRT